jgi:hypothetical protein
VEEEDSVVLLSTDIIPYNFELVVVVGLLSKLQDDGVDGETK